jgi:hypothetical protein
MSGYDEGYEETNEEGYEGYEGQEVADGGAEGVWQGYAPPDGAIVDAEGRLLAAEHTDDPWVPEDYETFIKDFRAPWMASPMEGQSASSYVWPDIPEEVTLKRLDLFELEYPSAQQGTTDREESRNIRNTPHWFPIASLFVLNVQTPFTKEVLIESTGPPRRHRFRLKDRLSSRDTSTWVYKECFFPFISADRIPGVTDFGIDFQDSPDRYFISEGIAAELGLRRLYRFGAYPATQYFILEKTMVHDSLESEGGSGLTCMIEKGPYVFMKKGWRLAGSFYAFDKELYGSNLYTVYARDDPFPLIQIAIGPIVRMEEWRIQAQFYAFDIPLSGSCTLTLQHCVRSIYSAASNVSRHRLTTDDPRLPWEFRMHVYVFPAELEDCSMVAEPVENGKLLNKSKNAATVA